MAKSERSSARNTAWKEFSLMIRARDAYEYSGGQVGRCCTCGRLVDYKHADAGHFVPGRTDSILFEETGVHIQCMQCNRFKQGKWVEYEEFMLENYGQHEVDRLKKLRLHPKKYSVPELRELAKEFRERRKEIEAKMGDL